MWKPSKRTLLVLMILMSIMGGLTFNGIDWDAFETAERIVEKYKEVDLPIIFFGLSVLFMLQYVGKIKEERIKK